MANAKGTAVRGLQNVRSFPIKSGETFKAGDFLTLTTTGAAAGPAASSNYDLTNKIVGRALHDSTDPYNSGATLSHVDVIIAEPGTQFEVPLYHGTPASAVPTQTQLTTAGYELRQSSTSFAQVDLSSTTNKAVRIVGFLPVDTPNWPNSVTGGAQYASAWVEFLQAASAAIGG